MNNKRNTLIMMLSCLMAVGSKPAFASELGNQKTPMSQEAYWSLIFHADSLYAEGRYAEAKRGYELAFSEDRYILPSQLTEVAQKMLNISDYSTALSLQQHRVKMEKDYYAEPSKSPFVELRDTFEQRKRVWGYDLDLKEQLEGIFERDQHDRILWSQAARASSPNPERTEVLYRQAAQTDSLNLVAVNRILLEQGFPRKQKVGEMALVGLWSAFQHNSLEMQKQFLPQLETAVARGDMAPAYLATLKDRIDVREGRPQKYGTQWGPDGKRCPLLDASRVNEWRQEVGLPPIH